MSTALAIDAPTFAIGALALDPAGLGGVLVRGWHGPELEAWRSLLETVSKRGIRRIPVGTGVERLVEAVDLHESLIVGRPVVRNGLLEAGDDVILWLPLAELLRTAATGAITRVIDRAADQSLAWGGLVAIDESRPDEPGAPHALHQRLPIVIDLPARWRPAEVASLPELFADARALYRRSRPTPEVARALSRSASALGIDSTRTLVQAERVARLSAALEGRSAVEAPDIDRAARLVLASRAVLVPEPQEGNAPPGTPEAKDDGSGRDMPGAEESAPTSGPPSEGPLEDRIVEAVRVALPPEVLAVGGGGRPGMQRVGGRGVDRARSTRVDRGRTVRTLRGDPRRGQALHLLETLRAAAPWQRVRGAAQGRLEVRPEDFRVRVRERPTPQTTIVLLDASGSQAASRLAETKGAVQLLLGESYRRRDEVALIAFRGRAAEEVLSPTRSLVRARRVLSGLPGGGGTPLASALERGMEVAERVSRLGRSPRIVCLTDGRPNVTLAGEGDRRRAANEALGVARTLGRAGFPVLILDASRRGSEFAESLAKGASGRYVRLPHVSARTVSRLVQSGWDASDP